MTETKFTDPQEILHKIDWEGSEGITWFNGDEFEDDELAQLVDDANHYYSEYNSAINAIARRVEKLSEASTDT